MGLARVDIGELIHKHYSALYRYAYRLCGRSEDASDLTQETFGRALTCLAQLRDPERARAWLFRILRNEYLHQVRDRNRSQIVPIDRIEDLPESLGDEEWVIDPATLQDALNDLDESFRTPLILYYFEEFSYREIAEQMELPIGTVMSRLARGKSYLRQRLTQEMPTPSSSESLPESPTIPAARQDDERTNQVDRQAAGETPAPRKGGMLREST